MKRTLLLSLTLFCLAGPAAAPAAEDIKLKLADAKFKLGASTPVELVSYNEGEGKIVFYAPGASEWSFKVSDGGDFSILVNASCDPAQNENAKFKLAIDGKEVGEEVALKSVGEKEYKLETKLAAGDHKLTITFSNDLYKEGEYDRNLYIHGVTLKIKK